MKKLELNQMEKVTGGGWLCWTGAVLGAAVGVVLTGGILLAAGRAALTGAWLCD